jgi:hypothetical protein
MPSTRSSYAEHRCLIRQGRLTGAHDRGRPEPTAAIELAVGGVSSLFIDPRRGQLDPLRLDALEPAN